MTGIAGLQVSEKCCFLKPIIIGSAQADPTVIPELRGKNHSSISPPAGPQAPQYCHSVYPLFTRMFFGKKFATILVQMA